MKPLPRHLREAVANVSTTIQQLVYAVALHASGLPDEPRMKPDGDTRGGWRRNHPTPEDRELLRDYVYSLAPEDMVDRCAIGVAALAGHTAKEIGAFYGWTAHRSVERKLEWLRYVARRRQ